MCSSVGHFAVGPPLPLPRKCFHSQSCWAALVCVQSSLKEFAWRRQTSNYWPPRFQPLLRIWQPVRWTLAQSPDGHRQRNRARAFSLASARSAKPRGPGVASDATRAPRRRNRCLITERRRHPGTHNAHACVSMDSVLMRDVHPNVCGAERLESLRREGGGTRAAKSLTRSAKQHSQKTVCNQAWLAGWLAVCVAWFVHCNH